MRGRKNFVTLMTILLFIFSAPVLTDGKIIYVDADATGANSGMNWTDAYNYLQDALVDANSSTKPVEIRVAQGVYKPDEDSLHPDGTGDREATFQLINGVNLKGGYAGFGEPDPNTRDIELYEAILSGDIGTPLDKGDNCYHVFYHPRELYLNNTAVLDGFTITGGNASSGWPHNCGGGMGNYDSSPAITNCTFVGNSAILVGGMLNWYSSPNITNCTFKGNSSEWSGGMCNGNSSPTISNCTFSDNSGGDGGGMLNHVYSSPTLTNCTFSGNSAGYGGGMHNSYYSSPTLTNCTFSGNSAELGGGMYNDSSSPMVEGCTFSGNSKVSRGGGMYNSGSSPTVANCTFEENAALNGGAIFSAGGTLDVSESIFVANLASQGGALVNLNGHMKLAKCVLRNNAEGTIFCFGNSALHIESCVFDNNYGGWHAIDCSNTGNVIEVINSLFTHNAGGAINTSYNSLRIVNSTLVDNHTTTFGGGVCCSYGSLSAVNCIMWGNTAEWDGNEIFGADASINVSYSCVTGGYPGTVNININPLFRAPASEDYHLLTGSPCIDAGDPNYIAEPNETDLDGKPRVIGGRIDMGAYEFSAQPIEVPMKFTPQAINCRSSGKWVKAHFVIPAEFTVEDVNTNSPAKAHPLGIESEYMNVFVNEDGLVEIEAAFERVAFCDAVKFCGPIEITVTGSFTDGRYFYDTDTIKIIKNSFECLAVLSSHWLEMNCGKPDWCNGFDADRATTVNLKDFAIMAFHWLEEK